MREVVLIGVVAPTGVAIGEVLLVIGREAGSGVARERVVGIDRVGRHEWRAEGTGVSQDDPAIS
jgi:hypothetical protein